MKTGDLASIRLDGLENWNPATITLASRNGESLAVEVQRGVYMDDGGGVFFNTGTGRVCLLLVKDGDVYRDVANPKRRYWVREREASNGA